MSLATQIRPRGGKPQPRPTTNSQQYVIVGVLCEQGHEPAVVRDLFNKERSYKRVELSAEDIADSSLAQSVDVALIAAPTKASDSDCKAQAMRAAEAGVGVVVLSQEVDDVLTFGRPIAVLPTCVSGEELSGALRAVARMKAGLMCGVREHDEIRRKSASYQRRYEEMDLELRLASRLQHDFLPREVQGIEPVRISTLFRPSNWVSGDIFDFFRLGDDHLGFYLADAAGHGVAAGLMTMYVKHCITSRRLADGRLDTCSPGRVLADLNERLVNQALPDSQFVTAWYGLLNLKTLELQYSVAGHPPALHVSTSGEIRELHGDGTLLGLEADQNFGDKTVQLAPGDRILVYSDGLEPTLIAARDKMPALPQFEQGIPELLVKPAQSMIEELVGRLERTPGSLTSADDVSILLLEIDAKPARSN
jgi:serine phosphatase RsbU (regulator of sigma subunit)